MLLPCTYESLCSARHGLVNDRHEGAGRVQPTLISRGPRVLFHVQVGPWVEVWPKIFYHTREILRTSRPEERTTLRGLLPMWRNVRQDQSTAECLGVLYHGTPALKQ